MAGLAKGRIFLAAAFLCPVIAGIILMAYAGAPAAYLLANAGAGCIVAIAFWWLPQSGLRPAPSAALIFMLFLLAATFVGPAVEDVHRWIAIGPVKLHAAMLVLPFFATQIFRHDSRMIAMVAALAALAYTLQPDRASALALFAILLCRLFYSRDRWSLAALAVSGAALGITLLKADPLPPVRFTENVIGEAAMMHPGLAILLLMAMGAAIAGPLYARRQGGSASMVAWAACLSGYFLASLAGSYPVPLLGYGVSSILGFGLALAVIGRESDEAA